MTKADKIRNFIAENKPTRRELVGFICVHCSGSCTQEEYDENPSKYRGTYGNAFQQWFFSKYIENKNGKIVLTKAGREAKGLYYTNWKAAFERLYDKRNNLGNFWRNRYLHVKNQNDQLRADIKLIETITQNAV